jgi:hypothetical protein
MPAGSAIYIFDPSIQPEVFYIHGQLIFTSSVKELPKDVPWLLAPDRAFKLLRERFLETETLAELREGNGHGFALMALHGKRRPGAVSN